MTVQVTTGDETMLAGLREEFAGRWRIWRGTRDDGRPPTLWCATRLDPRAGSDPTVIENSAARLVAALYEQASGGGDPRAAADLLDRW